MQLTEHPPGNHNVVRSVDDAGVVINDRRHVESVVVGAHLLIESWSVRSLDDLDEARIAPLIEHRPELVVLGVGKRQQLLSPGLQQQFHRHGIGLECMTLAAACRTFNVLMSENRRAVAGLVVPAGS